ncbi:MAG: hypothetical protein HEP71_12525 [Roseivirga sp.]|nr:hypothetical protein [Roseivirga sp.]
MPRFVKIIGTLSFGLSALWLLLSALSMAAQQEATFTLKGETVQRNIRFSDSKGNHIFGKIYNDYIWVRFATSPEKDGENSDHLDIDIWNFSGPGTYEAEDPKASKREGKKWNIWWHQDGDIFVNQVNSSPCQLIIEQEGEEFIGSFSCKGLKLNKGDTELNIENGSFRLTPVKGDSK